MALRTGSGGTMEVASLLNAADTALLRTGVTRLSSWLEKDQMMLLSSLNPRQRLHTQNARSVTQQSIGKEGEGSREG